MGRDDFDNFDHSDEPERHDSYDRSEEDLSPDPGEVLSGDYRGVFTPMSLLTEIGKRLAERRTRGQPASGEILTEYLFRGTSDTILHFTADGRANEQG